jgi:hypothetical protein
MLALVAEWRRGELKKSTAEGLLGASKVDLRIVPLYDALRDEWQGHPSSLAASGECCRSVGDRKGCLYGTRRGAMDCLHWGALSPYTAATNQIFYNQLAFET